MSDKEEDIEDVTLDPPASPSNETATTTFGIAGVYEVSIEDGLIPFVGQIIAAILLLIAIIVLKGSVENQGFGITACIVALLLAFGGVYLTKKPLLGAVPLGTLPFVGLLTYSSFLALLAFLWWFISAGILTFSGPFLVTSNGYFCCWAGVFFATMALISPEAMKEKAGGLGFVNGLFVASIIMLCALPSKMGSGKPYGGESVFSLIVVIVTLLAILAFQYKGMFATLKGYFFSLLAVVWVVMAALLTFRGPFVQTGNGYFASWVGAFCCVMVASSSRAES